MTDIRAGRDEDRLPWLEAVDEDEREEGPGAAKLIAFVVIGLLAIGLIVGGLFWMTSRSNSAGGETTPEGGELIAAPEGDYKIKPEQPGGMEVKGKGDTAMAASQGAEPKGSINTAAVSEAPVAAARPQGQAVAQPTPAPKTTTARPTQVAIAQPKTAPAPAPTPAAGPAPAAGGAAIQLGAFSSQASANTAWKNLSGRFKYLQPLSHSVVAAQSGGKTVYRLRANGADARSVCNRLRVAGESCVQVN